MPAYVIELSDGLPIGLPEHTTEADAITTAQALADGYNEPVTLWGARVVGSGVTKTSERIASVHPGEEA